MNRLILIGNGFDLAHGLKTCYKDFILWYIKHCFEHAHFEGEWEDCLISISSTTYRCDDVSRAKWVDEYLSKIEHPKRRAPTVSFGWDDDLPRFDMSPFNITYNSTLLEPLLSCCNVSNWVDIESEYFELLKDTLSLSDEEERQKALKELNESLAYVISRLEEYLIEQQSAPYIKGFEDIFLSLIEVEDLYPKRSNQSYVARETLILNFNYTNTPEQYIKRLTKIAQDRLPVINYIHGKLEDIDNELIFGFGDEIDASYKKMEDDNKVKGYFDYIKSFWYLRTDNYRSLVNFLDSDEYQVYVMGHSCGLSDRTMLQMIFEHEKCRSIKIYYYENKGADNFVSLTHEIARHFTDKGMMRKKIASKKRSERMPQHDD